MEKRTFLYCMYACWFVCVCVWLQCVLVLFAHTVLSGLLLYPRELVSSQTLIFTVEDLEIYSCKSQYDVHCKSSVNCGVQICRHCQVTDLPHTYMCKYLCISMDNCFIVAMLLFTNVNACNAENFLQIPHTSHLSVFLLQSTFESAYKDFILKSIRAGASHKCADYVVPQTCS